MTTLQLGLDGNDPVSYQQPDGPRPGSASITHEWGDTTWRFVDTTNRDAFAAEPQRYAPRYDGLCAFGVSAGKQLPGSATSWTVVDGRLYLAKNGLIKTLFPINTKRIGKADRRFAELQH